MLVIKNRLRREICHRSETESAGKRLWWVQAHREHIIVAVFHCSHLFFIFVAGEGSWSQRSLLGQPEDRRESEDSHHLQQRTQLGAAGAPYHRHEQQTREL